MNSSVRILETDQIRGGNKMAARNDADLAFLEYLITQKARDARICCERLEWEEDETLRNGDDRLLSLTLHAGGSAFTEHFLEQEIRRYLVDPEAFSSVEAKASILLGRVLRGTRAL